MDYQKFLGTYEFACFCDELEAKLREMFPAVLPGASLQRQWIDKLQGESYLSFTVRPEDSTIGINLNVSDLYGSELEARGSVAPDRIGELAAGLLQITVGRLGSIPRIDLELTDNYEKAKSRIITQLVAVRGNEEMLKTIPYRKIEDLAVVYRLFLNGESGIETCLINSSMLEDYGVTPEKLHQDAMENVSAVGQVTIKDLRELLRELTGDEADLPEPQGSRLFCLGTELKYFGASAILYPGVLARCAEKLGGSFYLLPSSVHEMLLLKDDGTIDPECLGSMIYEVNRATVDPSDRLTDHAYYYNCGSKEFYSV